MITIEEKRRLWLEKFEQSKALYDGRIAENIEKYRKGTASIRLTDAEGKPLCNARVKVKQKTHDFGFGAHIFLLDAFDTPEKCAEYRELSPKPAAEMLYHLIHEVWHTEYEAKTDEDGNLTVRGFYGDYELEFDEKTFELGLHNEG